jgi:hypothetical protein
MLAADPASKSALKKRLELFSSAGQPTWLNDKHSVVFVESQNSLQVELTECFIELLDCFVNGVCQHKAISPYLHGFVIRFEPWTFSS